MNKVETVTSYYRICSQPSVIRIISVGCGTGGDIIGMIMALHSINPQASFSVVIVDTNQDALDICRGILNFVSQRIGIEINIEAEELANISSKDALEKLACGYSDFNYVITSKYLNEVLIKMPNPYGVFAESFRRCLADDGLMIMVDVACKTDPQYGDDYIPKVMNRQIGKITAAGCDFSTMLPRTCGKCSAHSCENCGLTYTMYESYYSTIENGKETTRTSKFTYQVIADNNLRDRITFTRLW